MISSAISIFIISFIIFELMILFNALVFRDNLTKKTQPFGIDVYLQNKYNFMFCVFGPLCYFFVKKIKFLRTKNYIEITMKNWKMYSKRCDETIEEYVKSIGREKDLDRFIQYQRKIKLEKLK